MGRGGEIAPLLYHVIGYVKPTTPNQELWVSPATFAAQIRALARAGYHGVTLQRVYDAWHRGAELPSKPIVISFDDGYYGQYRNARPTLERHVWPGVLNLKLNNLADMGGVANLKRMVRDGWEIDDHTITHPRPHRRLPRPVALDRARSPPECQRLSGWQMPQRARWQPMYHYSFSNRPSTGDQSRSYHHWNSRAWRARLATTPSR